MSTQVAWNYNTLTAALQTWLDDTDADWVNNVTLAQVVQLGEQRCVDDFDLAIFDVANTSAAMTPGVTLAAATVTKPAGLIAADELQYTTIAAPSGLYKTLDRRDYSWVTDYLNPAIQGPPMYWAESTPTTWVLAPYPDAAYVITSWGPTAPTSLIDGSTTATTWISTNLSQILLEACLSEVAKLLKNAPARQIIEQTYLSKVGPMKKRIRSLRRDTLESPRQVSIELPEGTSPVTREQ